MSCRGWRCTTRRSSIGLLFRASAETLLEIAADPKHLGAEIGFLSVLHTWGQNLQHHPHIHCVIPAGGLSPDQQRGGSILATTLSSCRSRYSAVFSAASSWPGSSALSEEENFSSPAVSKRWQREKTFAAFLRPLFRQDWVVYAKRPFGGPEHVLHYLARYTHRVAISNHRLIQLTDGQVTFRWKDYAHGSKKRKMTITADEFLRRFLLHVLPKGFVRIRFFGFLANRRRQSQFTQCQQLLAALPEPRSRPSPVQPMISTWSCPLCGGTMVVVERLTAQQVADWTAGLQAYVDTS